MRERGGGGVFTHTNLANDDRLACLPCQFTGFQQLRGLWHAFKQTGDGGAVWVACKVSDFIRDMHVGAIAEGEYMTDVDAAAFGLAERKTHRARLAGDAHAGATRLVGLHFARGERHDAARREIQEAQAIGAYQLDIVIARDGC